MCVNAAYKASRLAVKYSPPTLFLEYTDAQQHTRVRAVKLSNISSATDPDYLTRKILQGFPRGLDPSTVNTQQVRQLLQQLIDRSSHSQQLRRANSSRSSRSSCSSGHGDAVAHSTPEGAETTRAACCAATTNSRRSSCHEQQQQQAGAGTVSQQQQSTAQHTCAVSGSAPGPSSQKQQQQCNCATSHYQQQQQDVHLPSAVSAVKQSLDTRLDGGDVSSVAKCSEQLEQKQQEQFQIHTSSVDTAVNSIRQVHSENAATANPGSAPPCGRPCADALAQAAPEGSANAPGCSSKTQSAAGAADAAAGDSEDSDGDCLVIEPEWVTPDGGEVDLNKVSDYELCLAKAQMNAAFQQNQLKPGDPGYVYDKQADFNAPRASNDWDDDE